MMIEATSHILLQGGITLKKKVHKDGQCLQIFPICLYPLFLSPFLG